MRAEDTLVGLDALFMARRTVLRDSTVDARLNAIIGRVPLPLRSQLLLRNLQLRTKGRPLEKSADFKCNQSPTLIIATTKLTERQSHFVFEHSVLSVELRKLLLQLFHAIFRFDVLAAYILLFVVDKSQELRSKSAIRQN